LERRLSGYFDTTTQASAIQRLSSFGVATDVPFSDYLRQFKLVVSSTTGVGRQTGPSDAMCQSYVRNSVAEQFPTLMPSLFPGTLAYRDVPYPSVDAMWSAFVHQENNLTPAIRGDKYSSHRPQSTSSTPHTSTGSRNRSNNSPRSSWIPPSVAGSVMSVTPKRDPFAASFDGWPYSAETWDSVYAVSTSAFTTDDPYLWNPLLTKTARYTAFSQHANSCINCNGHGHSMRNCSRPCINASGLMNPELQNNEPAFRRWQQRMRDYRTSNNHARNSQHRSNRDNRTNYDSSSSRRRDSSSRRSSSADRHQRTGPTHDHSNPNTRNPGSFLTDRTDP